MAPEQQPTPYPGLSRRPIGRIIEPRCGGSLFMVKFHVRVPARSGDFGHLKSLSRHRVCASIVHTMWCKKRCVCASIVHAECGTTPQGPRSEETGRKKSFRSTQFRAAKHWGFQSGMLGPDFLKYVATQHVTRTPASVSIRLIAKAAFDSSALRHGARTTTYTVYYIYTISSILF
jgi:hypothetical protein